MIKVLSLLKGRTDWTSEQFKRWWLEEHTVYAKKLPGLRKMTLNLTTMSPSHPGQEPFDGCAELWFDDREAMQAAFSSPEGKEATNHSKPNVSQRVVLIAEEHKII